MHRARVEATLGQQGLALSSQDHGHVLALELLFHLADHQVHHPDDLVASQLVEDDDVVDAVEELRPKCFFSSSLTFCFIRS